MKDDVLHLIGFACGVGGADPKTADGPLHLQQSPFFSELNKADIRAEWHGMISVAKAEPPTRPDEIIRNVCVDLAKKASDLARAQQFFTVIGGDHTSAIGTWSGVFDAVYERGDLGLIWVDAHMDSHTPETTESGRIHGMPLACLLGYGYPSLTTIMHFFPKLKPENVCLIGVRSFEKGEAEFLKRLNVRVYFMDEILRRGFSVVLAEAAEKIAQNTVAYGLSIDLDCVDPKEAPGVDVPEVDGVQAQDLCDGLMQIASDPKLIAAEIVEFDPHRDKDYLTERLVFKLLYILAMGKFRQTELKR